MSLYYRLYAPLLTTAAVGLLLSYVWDRADWCPWAQNVALNAAFAAGGVLLTIAYVERALRRHDERRWEHVDAVARFSVREVGHHTVNAFQRAFGISQHPFLPRPGDDTMTLFDRRVADVAESLLGPQVHRILELDAEQQAWLLADLRQVGQEIDGLFNAFGARLDPELVKPVLDVRHSVGMAPQVFGAAWIAQSELRRAGFPAGPPAGVGEQSLHFVLGFFPQELVRDLLTRSTTLLRLAAPDARFTDRHNVWWQGVWRRLARRGRARPSGAAR